MGSVVRAAGLRGLAPLVDGLGGDGTALLERFRVPPAAVDSDDAVVPSATAARILETAAAELRCPDLGLRLAEQQDTGVLGPLAVAIENSPTLGAALDCTSRFLFVHSPALTVAQVPDPDGQAGVVGLFYGSAEPQPLPPQVVDLGLGLFHRIIVLLHGGPYGLRSVHLPHPPLAAVSRYVDFFGTDARFERPAAVLRVPVQIMSAPVPGGNRLLRDVALDYIAGHFTEPEQTVTARVRHLLTQSLGTSGVHIAAIARLLQTHPRTLQRRLADEGTTFGALLDDVRRAAAHRLITQTDLPLGQVTAMVGLTEQSALTRATRRWFGHPPRALRRQA
ncbi:AraC family transcriptional regulator [Pseudonocardia nigra]|uniref:AraC family transcriptional regulator n=1 Tax=Pseudonocardia nigra TaxID=1921578 RepID=UPI001C5D8ADF|nr:AraC family transcriptional regulator [Pseudonocardia nigra]